MMPWSKLSLFVLTCAALAGGASSLAQQPAESTPAQKVAAPAAASTTTATAAQPAEPSSDTLKKARAAGYKTEVHSGVTKFCKEQTAVGSHFSTKNCLSEGQLDLVLEREQAARDQLTNHTCTGCSGK